MAKQDARYSNALNAIRFFASVWILLGHFGVEPLRTLGVPEPVLNTLLMRSVATSSFFLLSGFLLTQAFYGKRIDPQQFLTRRISRLYPVHAFYFIALIPTSMMGDIRFTPWEVVGHAAVWLTMLHGFFPRVAELYNSSAWAVTSFVLGYLALMWTSRWRNWSVSRLISTMCLLWLGAFLPTAILVATHANAIRLVTAAGGGQIPRNLQDATWLMTFVHIFPGFRVFEVMLGSLLALFSHKLSRRQSAQYWFARDWLLALQALALIPLLGITGTDPAMRYLVSHGLLVPWLAFGMLGIWFNHGRFETWLSGRALQNCGSSSMLIYFGHLPAGWGLVWAARHLLGLSLVDALRSPWLLLTLCVCSIVPSLLLWRPYERWSTYFASWLNRGWCSIERYVLARGPASTLSSFVQHTEPMLKKKTAEETVL